MSDADTPDDNSTANDAEDGDDINYTSPIPLEEVKRQRDLDRQETRTQAKRAKEADKEWRVDPVGEYLKQIKGDLTSEHYTREKKVVTQFEQYLIEEVDEEADEEVLDPRDAIKDDVRDFTKDELDNGNRSASSIVDYCSALVTFYNTLIEHDATGLNPAKQPLSKFRDDHDIDTQRPYIPRHRIEVFLNWLDHPLTRVTWLLAFKLGLRRGEVLNLDLRCLHIDHPLFWDRIEEHDIRLDDRIRNIPDSVLIYGNFNAGDIIPNDDTPGFHGDGEQREAANKRSQDGGSVLPIDSELKTALIEYLATRSSTAQYNNDVHPLFHRKKGSSLRYNYHQLSQNHWRKDAFVDSIQRFQEEEALEECPVCGSELIEENPTTGEQTGHRYLCQQCNDEPFWRSIYWGNGLDTPQKMTYHQGRHTFSSAHDPTTSGLHDGVIPDAIRKKEIRGDSREDGDTEDQVYIEGQYKNFDSDVREPYLNGIYKFDIYDTVIPAVGEGWDD